VKRLEFTPRSATSLVAVFEWTLLTFGERQADAYSAKLRAACQKITEGRAQHQSCRAVFPPDLREDLRLVRAGRHFIIFVEDEQRVLIVDFVHQSSDLPKRLAGSVP